MPETILIVDDEDSVRRTFQEWLRGSGLPCEVFAVSDAEGALRLAQQQNIDLAILDWNLGTGSDGLRLLEDLVEFHPNIVAILVTGFAHQATPLDALRMGVRDYLDKNQDLNRDTFLHAVRRQLERIIPAKRQREFNESLLAFRETVEKVLPLVQSSTTLNDPVPLPEAIRQLFRFLLRGTGAADGVLIVRHLADHGRDTVFVYNRDGATIDDAMVPFPRSLAATVVSLQEPCIINEFDPTALGAMELQSFEKHRRNLIAAPMTIGPGIHVVLELFDKTDRTGFNDADRRLVAAASDFGAEILRQALAERQSRRTLFDAVAAALAASERMTVDLPTNAAAPAESPLPSEVLDRLRQGLSASSHAVVDPDTSLELAEQIRDLAQKHGPAAVRHCIRLVHSLRELLDELNPL